MAAPTSYPRAGYNGGTVTTVEHETLVQSSMPDGLRGNPTSTAAPIYADGTGTRTVKLRANLTAFVRGSVFQSNDGVILAPLAANTSGMPRIDLIVLRLDRSDYSVNVVPLTGTPATKPTPPSAVRQTGSTGFYDVPLAEVLVAHNAGFLAADTVTTRAWFVGDDGQIRCTRDTRPPPDAGRQIYEPGTGRHFISNGSSWVLVSEGATAGSITGETGISYPSKSLYRINGQAHMGLIVWRSGGAFSANKVYRIGRLPHEFLPIADVPFTGVVPSSGQVFTGSVERGGQILMNPGAMSITAGYCVLQALSWPINTKELL